MERIRITPLDAKILTRAVTYMFDQRDQRISMTSFAAKVQDRGTGIDMKAAKQFMTRWSNVFNYNAGPDMSYETVNLLLTPDDVATMLDNAERVESYPTPQQPQQQQQQDQDQQQDAYTSYTQWGKTTQDIRGVFLIWLAECSCNCSFVK